MKTAPPAPCAADADGRAQDARQPEELAGLDSDSEGEGRGAPAARRKLVRARQSLWGLKVLGI